MDIMEKINDLRAQKGELLGRAEALVAEEKFEEADQITAKMEGINHRIAGLEKLAKASQGAAQPAYDGALHGSGRNPRDGGTEEERPFASLGEQLKAVYNFRKNHVEDKRLLQLVKKLLVLARELGKDAAHLPPGLFQPGLYLVEESHSPAASSVCFSASSRSSSMTLETPFSCIVTP